MKRYIVSTAVLLFTCAMAFAQSDTSAVAQESEFASAIVDGELYVFDGLIFASVRGARFRFSADGDVLAPINRQVSFLAPFGETGTFDLDSERDGPVRMSYLEVRMNPDRQTFFDVVSGVVTITESSPEAIAGRFEGTAVDQEDPDNQVVIRDGVFRVEPTIRN